MLEKRTELVFPYESSVRGELMLEINAIIAKLNGLDLEATFLQEMQARMLKVAEVIVDQEKIIEGAQNAIKLIGCRFNALETDFLTWNDVMARFFSYCQDLGKERYACEHEGEIRYLEAQIRQYEESFEQLVSDPVERAKPFEERVEAVIQRVSRLSSKSELFERELANQKQQNAQQLRLAEVEDEELKSLTIQLEQAREESQEQKNVIDKLKIDLEHALEQQGDTLTTVEQLTREIDTLTSNEATLQNEIGYGRETMQNYEQEISRLKWTWQRTEQEVEAATSSNQALEAQICFLEAEAQHFNEDECAIDELKREITARDLCLEQHTGQTLELENVLGMMKRHVQSLLFEEQRVDDSLGSLFDNYSRTAHRLEQLRLESTTENEHTVKTLENASTAIIHRISQLMQENQRQHDLNVDLELKDENLEQRHSEMALQLDQSLKSAEYAAREAETTQASSKSSKESETEFTALVYEKATQIYAQECLGYCFQEVETQESNDEQSQMREQKCKLSKSTELADSQISGFLGELKTDLGISGSDFFVHDATETDNEVADMLDFEALMEVANDLKAENEKLRHKYTTALESRSHEEHIELLDSKQRRERAEVEDNLKAELEVYEKQIEHLKKQLGRYQNYISSLSLDNDEVVKIVIGEDSLESQKISELESLVHILELQLCD